MLNIACLLELIELLLPSYLLDAAWPFSSNLWHLQSISAKKNCHFLDILSFLDYFLYNI